MTELPISTSGPLQGEGQGEVIHVDRFGNLITSFEGSRAPTGTWELEMEWHDRRLAVVAGRTYSDVTPGGLVLYPGSSGRSSWRARWLGIRADWGSTGNALSFEEDGMMAGKFWGLGLVLVALTLSACSVGQGVGEASGPLYILSCTSSATTAIARAYAELHRPRPSTA